MHRFTTTRFTMTRATRTRLRARAGALLLAVAGLVSAPTAFSGAVSAAVAAGPPASGCSSYSTPFSPVRASFEGVGQGYPIIGVGLEPNGSMGTPPLSTAGKTMVGFYTPLHVRAGSARGTIVLNAHAWPDGSALGNHLVSSLHVGGILSLTGARAQRACYRVTGVGTYPAARIPLRSIFKKTGAARVVLITCSGTRLGPGNWTTRTVWYASPI